MHVSASDCLDSARFGASKAPIYPFPFLYALGALSAVRQEIDRYEIELVDDSAVVCRSGNRIPLLVFAGELEETGSGRRTVGFLNGSQLVEELKAPVS